MGLRSLLLTSKTLLQKVFLRKVSARVLAEKDVGIVGDYTKVVPEMIAQLKDKLATQE